MPVLPDSGHVERLHRDHGLVYRDNKLSITVKTAKRWIIPVEKWPKYFPGLKAKDFLDAGVPLVEFNRERQKPLRGIMVHATSYNCPPGCFRVSPA